MKLYHKLIVLLISIISIYAVAKANTADLSVSVRWKWLIIWTPANIQLENFSSPKEVDFDDYFWIEDLRWSKIGHYTSIQWIVYWWDGEIVSGATVKFKTNSWNIILLWGVADNASFNTNLTSYTDITEPKLLFYRNDDSSHPWRLNKYWFKPSIKISVPNGSSGPYTVRLSYTLYDMSTNLTVSE